MPKLWRILPSQPDKVAALCRALNLPAALAQLLINRGITEPTQARVFLDAKLKCLHDPLLLPGAEDAADRIFRAIRDRRRIVIYGDYDVDGVCGTAILWHCLKLAGADVGFYVPHRLEEGYGLSTDALNTIKEQQNASLVVTVDCGITSRDEAAAARSLGIELIITDHHEFAEPLPEADCVVHPRLPGTSYPFGGLSGAGVAFKLAWAVAQRFSEAKKVSPPLRDFLLESVSLAALGTVADVVPLVDENRVLVRHGLVSLRSTTNPGLRALLESAGLAEKPALAADDIAFNLGPRINAAGRLGQARLAVELLTTASPERAAVLARYLHEQNELRQTVERKIFKEARELFDAAPDSAGAGAIVLAQRHWHAGVIGIVASRMAERYYRPVVLVSLGDEIGQGSGRSIPGFDLYRALAACRDSLVQFGGHAAAAGLKVRADAFEQFREQFCRHAVAALEQDQLVERLTIDAEVPLSALTPGLIGALENMAPFGAGNRRPVLAASELELAGQPRRMGGGGRHLSFRVRQSGASLRAVAFGRADDLEPLLAQPGRYALAFTPRINDYHGFPSVELEVKDLQPEPAPSPTH